MDKNVKPLFASKAREITEASNFLLRSVYRWIEDSATRNQSSFMLNAYEFDDKVLQEVINELKSSGYQVTTESDNKSYIINW